MKNTALYFVFVFVLLSFARQRVEAQCYVRLEDASGFNTDPYQAELEAAAAKLCAIFDTTGFAGQFKVYDFGFYLHQEHTTGGYPQPFAQKIAQVQALSPYYLLFGKQTDKTGVYTRFWVDLVLPDTGRFECIDLLSASLRGDLKAKYGIITNGVHEKHGNAHYRYHEAEIITMDSLISYINVLKECCIPSGEQQRGPSCSSCAFNQSEFASFLRNSDFAETQCTIKAQADSSHTNNTVNRVIRIDGVMLNVDTEIQKFVLSYKGGDSSKTVSVYTFAYPDKCSDLATLLEDAEGDSSCLVIVAGVIGEIGEEGSLFLKIFEKDNCHIKPNGPGYIYVYDLHGIYKVHYWGNHYHGIYFTDSPFYLGPINFKKNETKGDVIAKFSNFFISDGNIAYLKEMQKQCNKNEREYGGLVSLGGYNGELVFEECTSCPATQTSLSESTDPSNYSNYKGKDFVAHWHTHPNSSPSSESQTPSGLTSALVNYDYSGDFFVFKNDLAWQGDELGADVSAENTWRLPGRIGLIAGQQGVTIYRFVGKYFEAVGPHYGGYYDCQYHPVGLCYVVKGIVSLTSFAYSWITYDLTQKKP